MSHTQKITRSLSLLLVLAALAALVLTALQLERSAPPDPIGQTDAILRAEPMDDGSGSGGGQADPEPEPDAEPEPDTDTEPEEDPEQQEPGQEQLPGQEPGLDDDPSLPGDPDEPGDGELAIVTDLVSGTVLTQAQLPDGLLSFTAAIANGSGRESLRVTLTNSTTGQNGRTLSADGTQYQAQLVLGEWNTITIYLKQDGHNLAVRTYRIFYQANRADAEHPTIGDYPPSIRTRLDELPDGAELTSNSLTFWVEATTYYGEAIYSNQIQVFLNGVEVQKRSGDRVPEYELFFQRPQRGDVQKYTISVLAWDGDQSAYWEKTIYYRAVDEGQVKGQVSVVLDATVLGLGILDRGSYEVLQGEKWADILLKFCQEFGYEADYQGSTRLNFYLRRLSRPDMCLGAEPEERLWQLILRDEINLNESQWDWDSLGEFDYTMGSGWMYQIDGVFLGSGMSDNEPDDGQTMYIRFTLAYGKDVGGYVSTGSSQGRLAGYCGLWINGSYLPQEHDWAETLRQEPEDGHEGYIEYTCRRCGESKQEPLPGGGENGGSYETNPARSGPVPAADAVPAEQHLGLRPERRRSGQHRPGQPGLRPAGAAAGSGGAAAGRFLCQ